MTDAEAPRPALHIVRGNPTPEEIAVLTAVVSAAVAAQPAAADSPPLRGRWNDPAHVHRRPLLPGAGAWRAAGS